MRVDRRQRRSHLYLAELGRQSVIKDREFSEDELHLT